MKKLQKIICCLLVAAMLSPAFISQAAASRAITATINGQSVQFDQPPIIVDGRTLVPMRAIFEAMNSVVTWDAENGSITSVTSEGLVIHMQIGSNIMTAGGRTIEIDVPAQLINSRTLVPIRAISEAMGANVIWNSNNQTITITHGTAAGTPPGAQPPSSGALGHTLASVRFEYQTGVAALGLSIERLEYGEGPGALEGLDFMHILDYSKLTGITLENGDSELGLGDTLMIRTQTPLQNFEVIWMSNDSTEDEILFFPIEAFGLAETFLPGEAYIIHSFLDMGTMPWSAITFLDDNGQRWFFAIIQNQGYPETGSRYFLLELQIT